MITLAFDTVFVFLGSNNPRKVSMSFDLNLYSVMKSEIVILIMLNHVKKIHLYLPKLAFISIEKYILCYEKY